MNSKINIIEVENGNDKIGFNIEDNNYNIYIPKYYMKQNENEEESKLKIKKMFKAWNKYQKKNNSLLGKKYIKDNGIFDINTAMLLIQDYVENGLFIEQEKVYENTNIGKMNFKKTLDCCTPLYTKQGPIYLKYITNSKKENEESIIKQIQSLILKDISNNIGWIIGFAYNDIIHIKIDTNNNYMLKKLQELRDESFNSRKLYLIELLIKYIESNIATKDEEKGKIFIGMANLFWEDMINEVIGNVSKVDLEKYFYVRHAYTFENDNNNPLVLSSLMPDSVYKDEKNIIIIDSKYYINNSLPDNNDINKQIIYMLKANGIFPNHANYSNCFILPTDSENDEINNERIQAVLDLSIPNTPMNSINVLYANVEELLNKYINNEKNNEILKDLIIN